MKITEKTDENFFQKIEFEKLKSVDEIIKNVKERGLEAVFEYSKQFGEGDFNSFYDIKVSEDEIKNALKNLDPKLKEAIELAIYNIENFAKNQLSCIKDLDIEIGKSKMGHKIIPIENVLCYVPGGNYPLISSALMGVVPARVAGVKNIIVTSPKITPEVIAASYMAGARQIYKIGGAQAITAFAYGIKPLDKADKIVGPGNKYVTYAKKEVYGMCGIDFIAGPSEVLIVADKTSDPDFVARDILAQCEHDINARAYLIAFEREVADKIIEIANKEAEKLSDIAKHSFEKSLCIISNSIDEIVEITNKRAPEHLELAFEGAKNYADRFKNYGSLFIGNYSAEVFGDYITGPNHTLPTNQVAKYHGGLSVFDFIKIQTYQELDEQYAKQIAEPTSILAKAEGLIAHKMASDIRK